VIPGRAVGEVLVRAAERVHRQLGERSSETSALDQQASELLGRRSNAFVDLARHYLPEMTLERIRGTFVEIRDDLLEVLSRKERRQREISGQLAEHRAALERQEQQLAATTDRLNEKVAERERLEKLLAERLHQSDEFKKLSEQALIAERELERNEQRVQESKDEAARKLPSYEKSRLFKYLHDRGYGTSAYRSKGLTKRMDRWVAKLIDYPRARNGYEFLRVTPELMANEVERRRDQFNALMEQVEAIEDRVSEEIGLTAVMREGQALGGQRDQIVGQIAASQDGVVACEEELLRLERPENEFYAQAVARMQDYLANLRQTQLEFKSRGTPEHQDDAIVAEVAWLNDQLQQTDRQLADLNAQRQLRERQLAGLQQVLQRFRQANFDAQRSHFSDDLAIERLVAQFLEERVSAEQLWAALRESQQFAPAWHEQRGPDFSDVFDSDFSYVLMRVLAEVAGQALRNGAYRGVERRGPIRSDQRRQSGLPPFRQRGFSNGRGF